MMKKLSIVVGPLLLQVFLILNVWAGEQVGTLANLEGEVKIFAHPSKTLQKEPGTHVLFEGEYFLVEVAKTGDKMEQGNILRTAPGAKAQIIFNNGDQFNVGSATAFRIFWDKDAKTANTRMDLAYGKVRGIVEKGGPRSHFHLRTTTATMGVRGTDFFVAGGGPDGGTEISIIRGAVEVTSNEVHAKPIQVQSGFSVSLAKTTEPKLALSELRKTTQEELRSIQKSSEISKGSSSNSEIANLEKKAAEVTLKDIKHYDPQLYAKLEASTDKSVTEINRQAIQTLIPEAPRAAAGHAPFKSEVDNLEDQTYEKYFEK